MGLAATVAGPKAFSNHLSPGLRQHLPIQQALPPPPRAKHSDAFDPGVTQEVVNVPVQLFTPALMPSQAVFQAIHGASRIDVLPCGEYERPQLPHLKPHGIRQMQMKLIDSRRHRRRVPLRPSCEGSVTSQGPGTHSQ